MMADLMKRILFMLLAPAALAKRLRRSKGWKRP